MPSTKDKSTEASRAHRRSGQDEEDDHLSRDCIRDELTKQEGKHVAADEGRAPPVHGVVRCKRRMTGAAQQEPVSSEMIRIVDQHGDFRTKYTNPDQKKQKNQRDKD